MPDYFKWLPVCLSLSLLAACRCTPTDAPEPAMLAELEACFAGRRTPEEVINGWKWGDVKYAFAFDLKPAAPGKGHFGMVFTACPPSPNPHRAFLLEDFPKVSDTEEDDKPYLSFGVQRDEMSQRRSLAYVFCGSYSEQYPSVLKHLGLGMPTYEEARSRHPSQCWETVEHAKGSSEPSPVDDQFIRRGSLNPGVDIFFRFWQRQCEGVMLVRRETVTGGGRLDKTSPDVAALDVRIFGDEFRWVPDHQIKRFEEMDEEGLAKGMKPLRRTLLDRDIRQFQSNKAALDNLGARFAGSIKTPMCAQLDAPWKEFGFYRMGSGEITLRSFAERSGVYSKERVVSFVLEVDSLTEGKKVLLPYGLDIEPSRKERPAEGVLYEHVRCDGRARIVVQPHAAWLYENGTLTKMLVCGDKDGSKDHSWSLVREFYCYEEMAYYYWPVSRAAYDPIGD